MSIKKDDKVGNFVSSYKIVKKVSNTKFPCTTVRTSNDVALFLENIFNEETHVVEHFYVLFLSRRNEIYGYTLISQGGLSGTVVDTKVIAKYISEAMPNGIILCHNHPSGNLTPSEADKELTRKVIELCKYMDIKLLDHIIVTDCLGYYSFADNGDI